MWHGVASKQLTKWGESDACNVKLKFIQRSLTISKAWLSVFSYHCSAKSGVTVLSWKAELFVLAQFSGTDKNSCQITLGARLKVTPSPESTYGAFLLVFASRLLFRPCRLGFLSWQTSVSELTPFSATLKQLVSCKVHIFSGAPVKCCIHFSSEVPAWEPTCVLILSSIYSHLMLW